MILVPLPYKLYGVFRHMFNIWKTSCTNRKVNRGWQIYFDSYHNTCFNLSTKSSDNRCILALRYKQGPYITYLLQFCAVLQIHILHILVVFSVQRNTSTAACHASLALTRIPIKNVEVFTTVPFCTAFDARVLKVSNPHPAGQYLHWTAGTLSSWS